MEELNDEMTFHIGVDQDEEGTLLGPSRAFVYSKAFGSRVFDVPDLEKEIARRKSEGQPTAFFEDVLTTLRAGGKRIV